MLGANLPLTLSAKYSRAPCNFLFKHDWRERVTISGVTEGGSPVAIFLAHVNELVGVRVRRAVIVRSLHFSAPSSLAGAMTTDDRRTRKLTGLAG